MAAKIETVMLNGFEVAATFSWIRLGHTMFPKTLFLVRNLGSNGWFQSLHVGERKCGKLVQPCCFGQLIYGKLPCVA